MVLVGWPLRDFFQVVGSYWIVKHEPNSHEFKLTWVLFQFSCIGPTSMGSTIVAKAFRFQLQEPSLHGSVDRPYARGESVKLTGSHFDGSIVPTLVARVLLAWLIYHGPYLHKITLQGS
jgi:hypothetical protein